MISAPAHTDQTAILTPQQIAEANHYRGCGVPLRPIAELFGLTEFELKVQISAAERHRQVEALAAMVQGREVST